MAVPVSVRFKLMSGAVLVAGQPAPDGTTPTEETYRFNFQPIDPAGELVVGGDNFVYDTQVLADTSPLDIGHTYRLSFEIEDDAPTISSATTHRTTSRPVRA